jgi:membrane protein
MPGTALRAVRLAREGGLTMTSIWILIKQTVAEWREDKASRLGAGLAYYTTLSLAPLLVVVIAVAGLVFGAEAARGQIVAQFADAIGPEAAELIESALVKAAGEQGTGILATIIGIVTLLLGATGVFGHLQDALNTIWEVAPRPGRGLRAILRKRVVAFTMVLAVGFVLLVAQVLSAGIAAVNTWLGGWLPVPGIVLQAVSLIVSFAAVTFLFALIFKYVPDVRIAWRDVWIGAAVTALLFAVGKELIALYLATSSVGSAYGAAGTLLAVLVWIYYAAQILFLGAEFTQVYATQRGSHVQPAHDAVPLTEGARIQQGLPRPEQVAAAQAAQDQVTAAGREPKPGERVATGLAATSPAVAGHSRSAAPATAGATRAFRGPLPVRYGKTALAIAAVLATTGGLAMGALRALRARTRGRHRSALADWLERRGFTIPPLGA